MFDLLEREESVETLEKALRNAVEGAGRVVLISGEAGIGKTALVSYFTDLHAATSLILWGGCEALFTPRPLGPLYDIAYQSGSHLQALLEVEAERPVIFNAFLDLINESASPVIVVMEDVHWADEATLDLLKFVGRRVRHTRVLFLVTYRDDEVGPDHPLRFVLGDLPIRTTVRLRLFPLSENAVEMLARSAGRSYENLYAITGGNPFFVTEALAGQDSDIPSTVRDAVLARTLRLSRAAREVLEIISIIPGRTERWLLEVAIHPKMATLDECIQAGLLRLEEDSLTFRHELARMAIEATLFPPHRKFLHKRVLATLSGRAQVSLARLVYHADQAGDASAVLRYAPTAARQAAALSAHREAASHYRTALRFADALSREEQAQLLENRSYECYLTDQIEVALQDRLKALKIRELLDQPLQKGNTMRWISRLYWFSGRKAEADQFARAAIDVLVSLPLSAELTMAYSNLSQLHMLADEAAEAMHWGFRAIELAERLGATETLIHALNNVGTAQLLADDPSGWDNLERSLQLALNHNHQEHAARAYTNLSSSAVTVRDYARAMQFLNAGMAYTLEHDLDSWLLYMSAWRARTSFALGKWTQAADDAGRVLSQSQVPPITRIPALAVLGHIRIRRGDPEATPLLDEALALATLTGELQRMTPVASARAEVAWLAGNLSTVRTEVHPVFEQALLQSNPWVLGEMSFWLWLADDLPNVPKGIAEPYAFLLNGSWSTAADVWQRLGCPYEQAIALSFGNVPAQKKALTILEELQAAPAAEMIRQKLRAAGVRGIHRGPRPGTRSNPGGLTDRQLEILRLLTRGLTNVEIADHLFISPKTVGHHVSAILAKLEVNSRTEAALFAVKQGLFNKK